MQTFQFSDANELKGMIARAMRAFPDCRPGQAMCTMYQMDKQTEDAIKGMEYWPIVYGYLLHQKAYTQTPESFYPARAQA